MASLKFALWNSGGLTSTANSTPLKTQFFNKEFPNDDFDCAAFVETHHREEKDLPSYIAQRTSKFHLIHTPTPTNFTHAGIAVLISKTFSISSSSIAIPGRLLNIKIKHTTSSEEHNISVLYNITNRSSKKEDVISLVTHLRNLHDISHSNIILGDFNFIDLEIDKGSGFSCHD